jgi:hypothetical protein
MQWDSNPHFRRFEREQSFAIASLKTTYGLRPRIWLRCRGTAPRFQVYETRENSMPPARNNFRPPFFYRGRGLSPNYPTHRHDGLLCPAPLYLSYRMALRRFWLLELDSNQSHSRLTAERDHLDCYLGINCLLKSLQ